MKRVTATESPTPRTKNPKKVAAGKAAYAARKEKEAKMLEDLQNAKMSLRDESLPDYELSAHEIKKSHSIEKSKNILFEKSNIIWITGLVGLGAVACYYYFQSKPAKRDFQTGSPKSTSHAIKVPGILNTSSQSNININDPFYMQ